MWMKTKVATSGGGVRMEIITIEGQGSNFRFIAAKKKIEYKN